MLMKKDSSLKVACWNINSVRARISVLNHFLSREAPEILMLQEIKCLTEQFSPEIAEDYNYNAAILGQKSHNGVAILSKFPLEQLKTSFPGNPCPDQARFIQCSCMTNMGYVTFICVYVPNGYAVGHERFILKLQFLEALMLYLRSELSTGEHLVVGGDFNVALQDIDVYSAEALVDKLGFTTDEKQRLAAILDSGLVDCYRALHPQERQFSWWDYRTGSFKKNLGMRIDLLLASQSIASSINTSVIDLETRSTSKTSDHAPITVSFRG